jgi:uncharacterized membrane protein
MRAPSIKKLEDNIARVIRSWTFIITQAIFIGLWIYLNHHFPSIAWDNKSFDILRLVITIESSFVGSILLMAQHRQAEVDRKVSNEDYELDKEMSVDMAEIKRLLQKEREKTP